MLFCLNITYFCQLFLWFDKFVLFSHNPITAFTYLQGYIIFSIFLDYLFNKPNILILTNFHPLPQMLQKLTQHLIRNRLPQLHLQILTTAQPTHTISSNMMQTPHSTTHHINIFITDFLQINNPWFIK